MSTTPPPAPPLGPSLHNVHSQLTRAPNTGTSTSTRHLQRVSKARMGSSFLTEVEPHGYRSLGKKVSVYDHHNNPCVAYHNAL